MREMALMHRYKSNQMTVHFSFEFMYMAHFSSTKRKTVKPKSYNPLKISLQELREAKAS